MSSHHNDSEFIGELDHNGMFIVPEARSRINILKAACRAISAFPHTDSRTFFMISNWNLANFAGANSLGVLKAFPVSVLASKECVQNGNDGTVKGISSNRHQRGVQSGTIRYLNNGILVFVCTLLIIEASTDEPFTYLAAVINISANVPLLVPNTSIMSFSNEHEFSLRPSKEHVVDDSSRAKYFALVLPLLGNGLKNDANTFQCLATKTCWKGEQNVFIFSPTAKIGRVAYKRPIITGQTDVPMKRPTISPKRKKEKSVLKSDKIRHGFLGDTTDTCHHRKPFISEEKNRKKTQPDALKYSKIDYSDEIPLVADT
jgi:hypothetical protein